MKNDVKYLIIHHSGGTESNPLEDTSHHTFAVVNEDHRQKWNFKSRLGYYIGYHYFIEKSGKVTQGRFDHEEGAHTIGKNRESLGICLAGNFDLTFPTLAQINALTSLLAQKQALYGVLNENIIPHRHFAYKSCYGRNLPDNWARNLLVTPSQTQCVAEKEIILTQKEQINRLQLLVQSIKDLFQRGKL